MNCRQARRAVQQLLDGEALSREALDGHVRDCASCRSRLDTMLRLHAALGAALASPVGESVAEPAVGVVVPEAVMVRPPIPLRPRLAPALVALALVLGFVGGHALWPRERVVTCMVEKPVERRIEVPVTKERVVVREVPAERLRVVYRDRVVEAPAPGQAPPARTGEPRNAPVKLDEVVVRIEAPSPSAPPVVSSEIRPVTVVGPESPAPAQAPPPGRGAESGVAERRVAWRPVGVGLP